MCMNADYFKQMMDMQKDFYENWQKNFSPDLSENFGAMFKPYFDLNQKFFGSLKSGDAFDVYKKMLGGSETYLSVFKLWQNLVENSIKPMKLNAKEMIENWESEMSRNFTAYVMPYVPEQFKTYVKNPTTLFKLYRDITNMLLGPWLDDYEVDFEKYIIKGPNEYSLGYIDFVSLWKENYELTIGKILNSPAFGSNREYIEKQNEFVNTFVQYLTNIGEFSASIYATSFDTVKKVIADFAEMAMTDAQPKTFREFYEYWSKEIDGAYDKLFTTQEFSKLIGHYVDSTMDFKMKLDSVMEDFVKLLPVPTRSEMNSLYKTVDTLKREVRDLKKEIEELKSCSGVENGNV